MSEEQKEMQVEAAEKAAKKVAPVTTAEPEENFDWDAYEKRRRGTGIRKRCVNSKIRRNSF